MNKKALEYYGKTEKDYQKWCKKNNLPHYALKSFKLYVKYLQEEKDNERTTN